MGFFSKLFGGYENNDPRFKMAIEVVDKLGEEKDTYDAGLALAGGYHHDHVYDGYGLKIVKPDISHGENTDVYVNFNGQRVFDRNTYIPGRWEEVFDELYKSIGVILEDRRYEADLLKKKQQILGYLCQIPVKDGRINISDEIEIESYDSISGYYDEHYNGTSYSVYVNGEEVYSAFRGNGLKDDKFYDYKPGTWEGDIKRFAQVSQQMAESNRQQQIDNYASENIKKLRKLRDKKY